MKELKLLMLATVLAFSSSYAQMSQDQVGEMATAYFKAHPEKMMDILKGLQQHAQKQQEMQAKQNIVNSKSFFLGKDSFLPVMGNHNADKTLVFIYDFQCIYCHKEWPLIAKLMKENKDFKVVFMPLHFFGPASKLAAQAALYAKTVGKFEAFYKAMEATGLIEGKLKKEDVYKVMKQVEINKTDYNTVMHSGMLDKQIHQIDTMAQKLMVRGTPYMIIMPGHESDVLLSNVTILPGFVSAKVIKHAIYHED